MNMQKVATITAAILINCAVLAWFHAWSDAAVASAAAARAGRIDATAKIQPIQPSRHATGAPAPQGSANPDHAAAGGQPACVVLPYYSFTAACPAGTNG